MILTELCRVDKALFLFPESRVPDTVICKRMAVSGTPLSPSFGTQEGKGERSNTCGGNPHHTPHGTGTLLTLRAMTASAPCSSSRDGQQVCGCHSYGFRMVCPRCHGPRQGKSLSLVPYPTFDVTACTAFTPRWRENAVDAVTIHYLFLVHMLPSGICFLPCKGTSRQLDGIGFHSEHIGNLPFRAGFESVFPTFSAQTFRMPCG